MKEFVRSIVLSSFAYREKHRMDDLSPVMIAVSNTLADMIDDEDRKVLRANGVEIHVLPEKEI